MQGAGIVEKTISAPVDGPLSVSVKAPMLMVVVRPDPHVRTAVATITSGSDIEVKSEPLGDGWLLEWPRDMPGTSFRSGNGNIQVKNFGGGRVIIGDSMNITFGPGGDTYISGRGVRSVDAEPMPTLMLRLPITSSLMAEVTAGQIYVEGPYSLAMLNAVTQSADVRSDAPIGALSARTQSGDIEMRAATGQVQANTMSGDIDLAEARGPVTAQTMSGGIDVTAPEGCGMNLGTMSGDVKARVPRGCEQYVLASTMSGGKRVQGF
jgi:hypothetical protein